MKSVWNQQVEELHKAYISQVNGGRVEYSKLGQIITATAKPRWPHPWTTTAQWNGERWMLSVQAGFVNGEAPVVRQRVDAAPLATVERLGIHNPATVIDVPLYDNPEIPATNWYAIGRDGAAGVFPPRFFAERGVSGPAPSLEEQLTGPVHLADLVTPKGNRLLRSCTVLVRLPRTGLTAQTDLGQPTVDGWSIRQTLGVASPPPDAQLSLMVTSQPRAAGAVSAFDPASFDSIFIEPTWDDCYISTVYLLSPEDAPLGSAPDGTWKPYVQHHEFFNLNYAQPQVMLGSPPDPLQLFVPLAGGLGQPIISGLLSTANDAFTLMTNYLQANSLSGKFWSV